MFLSLLSDRSVFIPSDKCAQNTAIAEKREEHPEILTKEKVCKAPRNPEDPKNSKQFKSDKKSDFRGAPQSDPKKQLCVTQKWFFRVKKWLYGLPL